MHAMIFRGLLVACFIVLWSPSASSEQCNEVLAGGAFMNLATARSTAFDEYLYMEAFKRDYEASKHDTIAGLSVPIGSMLIGGSYSVNEWENKRSEIRDTLAHRIAFSDLEQTLLSEGDPAILAAWRDCIAHNGGGLSARFESGGDPNGHDVIFVLEYVKPWICHQLIV